MPRYLIDEDLPHLLASLLLERGNPSEQVRDVDLRGSPGRRAFQTALRSDNRLESGVIC
jgi:hypothetical protein